jgi:hypothetical protein
MAILIEILPIILQYFEPLSGGLMKSLGAAVHFQRWTGHNLIRQ